jgi:hypothetical protein
MEDDQEARKARIKSLIRDAAKPKRTSGKPPLIEIGGNVDKSVVAVGDVHVHHHHPAGKPIPAKQSDREVWRKELYAAIWARAAQIKLPPDQLYALAAKKLRKRVSGLGDLNERDLGRVYDLVFTMKRPALDS